MQASPSPINTPREPSAHRTPSSSTLAPGRVVGGTYVVIEPLGQGGMGQVYLARDERLDRQVALKVLPADQADKDARARFLREARALGRIEHDNVVRVFASGDDDGLAWMALEVIAGEPLSALADGGPIDEETALLLCAQIARGLAAVHAVSVVHRDVKPSNVLVDDDATVKLIDFGVAFLEGHHGGFTTRAGIVVGTPHFMSPEQARGGAVDARADAWGLGATLYALLAGTPPFWAGDDEADLDILARVVRDDVPDIRLKAPDTSAATAALLHDLLRRAVDERPGDLAAVADRLEAIVNGTAPPASPILPAPSAVAVPTEVAPTTPAPTAGAGLASIVAIVVVVVIAVALGAVAGQRLAPPQERIVERVVEVKVPVEVPVKVPVPVEVKVPVPVVPAGPPALPTTPEALETWGAALIQRPLDEQASVVRDLVARGEEALPPIGHLLDHPAPIGTALVDHVAGLPPATQDPIWTRALSSTLVPEDRAIRVVEILASRRNDTALLLLRQTARDHPRAAVRQAAARARDSIFKIDE